MPKTESEIKFDFQQAQNQAKELEEIAAEMKTMANKELQEVLQNLSSNWTGEAAAEYLKKGGMIQERVRQNAKNLENTANTIRSTAKRIYDAEMMALAIAKARTY